MASQPQRVRWTWSPNNSKFIWQTPTEISRIAKSLGLTFIDLKQLKMNVFYQKFKWFWLTDLKFKVILSEKIHQCYRGHLRTCLQSWWHTLRSYERSHFSPSMRIYMSRPNSIFSHLDKRQRRGLRVEPISNAEIEKQKPFEHQFRDLAGKK